MPVWAPTAALLTVHRVSSTLAKENRAYASAVSCSQIMFEKRGTYGDVYANNHTNGANWQYPETD